MVIRQLKSNGGMGSFNACDLNKGWGYTRQTVDQDQFGMRSDDARYCPGYDVYGN
jgi:hypothetical protein